MHFYPLENICFVMAEFVAFFSRFFLYLNCFVTSRTPLSVVDLNLYVKLNSLFISSRGVRKCINKRVLLRYCI